ncbi:probable endoplasmic reticulum retention protein Rer1 [Cyanidioschyzon merolae strain 10D]|uniref:Probable endoplasmic reticulum retention protein Rer1 n=1 Tax=Cyanidioschyzon merolae (strain NIES-3377 / 10D) TaxID=280699 RepID=M1VC93_CYAM1|nr:probable endoplasmic reticulum retention protein Rer1 [Cyanidioschyzon merolae strain 10D]BAM80127.1 probable endoplasmic reticulum retention protein Rer1 [Cyanidioschyzon merolae strain 10D]|eukprot:XP_005536413.1 probable endoplasmic reticulum retention protein Rer1 [Cyanidioschyzon merolae strain 10D]
MSAGPADRGALPGNAFRPYGGGTTWTTIRPGTNIQSGEHTAPGIPQPAGPVFGRSVSTMATSAAPVDLTSSSPASSSMRASDADFVENTNLLGIVRSYSLRYSYRWRRRLQHWLDISVPHRTARWLALWTLGALFALRVYWTQGFYVVAYALAIYNLNLMLGFLQPRDVNEIQEDERIALPIRRRTSGSTGAFAELDPLNGTNLEYRPFVRRLPEFQFWWQSLKSVAMSFVATLVPIFDVPVYWPVLVLYFLVLFSVTMKRQIEHMRLYGYVPFSWGKQRYGGRGSRLLRIWEGMQLFWRYLTGYDATHTRRRSTGGRAVTSERSSANPISSPSLHK